MCMAETINILSLSLKIDDRSTTTFCVLVSGFIGFSQLVSEPCVSSATCPLQLPISVGRGGAAWFERGPCRLAGSKAAFSEKRRKEERGLISIEKAWSCQTW